MLKSIRNSLILSSLLYIALGVVLLVYYFVFRQPA